jgi:hypothetical protein
MIFLFRRLEKFKETGMIKQETGYVNGELSNVFACSSISF